MLAVPIWRPLLVVLEKALEHSAAFLSLLLLSLESLVKSTLSLFAF